MQESSLYDWEKFFLPVPFYIAALGTGTALTKALRWVGTWQDMNHLERGQRSAVRTDQGPRKSSV